MLDKLNPYIKMRWIATFFLIISYILRIYYIQVRIDCFF